MKQLCLAARNLDIGGKSIRVFRRHPLTLLPPAHRVVEPHQLLCAQLRQRFFDL